MDKKLEEKLNKLVKGFSIIRKVSSKATEECPVYNQYENIYMESDEQLRNRIKRMKK